MPFRDMQRAAVTLTVGAAITLGPALDAGQTGVPSVQYRSPEGVEYRSLPETDAVKSARAALEASPKSIPRIIDLAAGAAGVGTPAPLFTTRLAPVRSISRQQYVVAPDGQQFLISSTEDLPTSPITLILNWKGARNVAPDGVNR